MQSERDKSYDRVINAISAMRRKFDLKKEGMREIDQKINSFQADLRKEQLKLRDKT